MTQNSADTRQKLIKAGIYLAKRHGLNGFSVRRLCQRAKVNLGLFNYYFSTFENFHKSLFKDLYGSFIKGFEINLPQELPADKKLEIARKLLCDFVCQNSQILASLIVDVMSGNKKLFGFLKENFTKHLLIINSIVESGKKEKVFKDAEPLSILLCGVAPVLLPLIVAAVADKIAGPKYRKKIIPLMKKLTSEKSLKERIELSSRGILK